MAQSKIIPLAVVVIVAVAIVGTYYAVSPAAPVTPGVTTLSVDTTPVKGEVSVDGVSWGTAPVSREVDPGTYTVTFGAVTDYTAPATQSVTVASGEIKSITVPYVSLAPEKLKMAFILAGSLTDAGWNASLYSAAHEVGDELNLDVAVLEGVGQVDIEPYLRDFATRGYKIIWGHAFPYADSILRVAPDYPDVWFIHGNGDSISEPNVATYPHTLYGAGYLAGILAAGITETNKIGFITGFFVPNVIAELNTFKLGAQSVNPDIEVTDVMTGAWDDVTKGREFALSMIDGGVDVILGRGDGTVLGIIQACSLRGVYAIGDVTDQNPLAPETIVSSCIMDWRVYIRDIVERYRAGTLENTVYRYALAEGATYLATYHGLEDVVPQYIKDMINEVIEDVKAGTFSITVDGTVYNDIPNIEGVRIS